MPEAVNEIEIYLEQGVLSADFDEGRLVIDTGSPYSLGPNIDIQLLGRVIRLQPSLIGFPWSRIQESMPFNAVGLIGVDAFVESTFCLDISGGALRLTDQRIDGESMEFAIGSPTVHCAIASTIQRCIIDTGAKMCYITDAELANAGDYAGQAEDFHPLLGEFTVETYDLPMSLFGIDAIERVAVAPPALAMQLQALNIGGVIGTSLLARGVLTIDFRSQVIDFS